MPPRVAYWCTSVQMGMEAVANQAALLRDSLPGSALWGVSNKRWLHLARPATFVVHPALYPLFRLLTASAQNRYDLNHVIGSLGEWHLLRAARKRPLVLTVCLHRDPVSAEMLRRIDRFIIEWPAARLELERLGVASDRIRLIYPPADLSRFTPAPPPDAPFTAVFASSPDRAQWLEARGVGLILEAARLRPAMNFLLCWRPWGDSLPRLRQMIGEAGVGNVHVEVGRVPDMADVYRRGHATIFCMTDPGMSKPAPNSVVESLACGRPVVVTAMVGLSHLIANRGAGRVVPPRAGDLAQALDAICADWGAMSRNARELAVRNFDQTRFIQSHLDIYKEII